MAYYYVKTGGTATGDGGRYATKQTGAWFATSTDYYATVNDALSATTAPADGDIIIVSENHNESASSILFGFGTAKVSVVSVDDTAIDTYKAATSAQFTASGDLIWNSGNSRQVSWFGCWFQTGDDMRVGYDTSFYYFFDCKFVMTGAGDLFQLNQEENIFVCVDCEFEFGATSGRFSLGDCGFYVYGGSVTCTAGTLVTLFDVGNIGNGNGFSECVFAGVDLSDVAKITNTNNTVAEAPFTLKVLNCQLASGVVYVGSSNNPKQKILVTGSRDGASAEYQYLYIDGAEQVEEDTQIYRDESIAWPDGTKTSLKITTTSYTSKAQPFIYEMPGQFVELSSAASDVISVYLASTSTLYEDDVWASVIYPDGTSYQIGRMVSSRQANILNESAVELTTDAGSDWRDGASALSGYNEYKIDLDTSVNPGSDSVPIVRLFVAKAATIYVCPVFGTA